MRELADATRIRDFLKALGAQAEGNVRVYLTGGATAVLLGWRATTLDLDLKIVPDSDRMLAAIPRLKEALKINVELASPDAFIPELPDWEARSPLITREGTASFYHYDFYAQALSKLERGHDQDMDDVREMVRRGLLRPAKLLEYFEQIEPRLYRYPSIDAPSFRRAVEDFVRSTGPA